MEIKHRISFDSRQNEPFIRLLMGIGIKYKSIEMPGGDNQFIYFDINESDPLWPEVSPLVQAYHVLDGYDTFFTQDEILNAEWVRLISTYSEGFPQPYNTWVTNPINYKKFCRECGTFEQESSFHIKREPNLRGNDFMTINWAVSAFFCTPKVKKEFEIRQIKGFEVWNVIIHKTQASSQRIFQLFVPNETSTGLLNTEVLVPKNCPQCNITKYSHHRRGIMQFKRIAMNWDFDIIRTSEWFGAGGDAYQEILISNRVVRTITDNGWKGVRFKVIELV